MYSQFMMHGQKKTLSYKDTCFGSDSFHVVTSCLTNSSERLYTRCVYNSDPTCKRPTR